MAEQLTCNQQVVGSTPTWSSTRPLGQAVKTPPFHGGNRGSIPLGVTIKFGSIAQLGEHLPYKQRVTGSIPVVSTKYASLAQWQSSWLVISRLLVRLRHEAPNKGEFPSGQRGQTVNLLRFASMVRIRPPPPKHG